MNKFFIPILLMVLSSSHAQPDTLSPQAFREAFLAGDLSWERVLEQAQQEGTVRWYHWGGAEDLNIWIDTVVKPDLAELGIELETSRLADTREAVDLVITEAAAGRELGQGSVDAIWINGENFFTLASQDLLFGAFADKLPNSEYFVFDADDSRAAINLRDNGYPTELREIPWASFQYICVIDSNRLAPADAPRTFEALRTWLQRDAGRFTYVRPPNYIGNAFVMAALYAHSPNGYADFQQNIDEVDPETFTENIRGGMDYLREIAPFLLGGSGEAGVYGGTIYPETEQINETFFNNGEVDMQCQFGTFSASVGIDNGEYPASAENIIFPETGMIANKSFISIPSNAPNPAAALVLANYLSSIENQASKLEFLGYAPGVDSPRLSVAQQDALREASPPLLGVTFAQLAEARVPEANSTLVTLIENVWEAYVLEQSEAPLLEIVYQYLAP